MKVLLSCASFLPSYGGPAISVSSLARYLAQRGHEVSLWAPDGSATSSPFVSSEVLALDGRIEDIEAHVSGFDLWHDNGIWLPHNHAIARLTRRRRMPRLVSVRGMLQPPALRQKRLKKRVAWLAYQRADLLSASGLHATAQDEAERVSELVIGRPVKVIPNGADMPKTLPAKQRPATCTALFLGRLHPIKGLPMLLEAWRRTMPQGWRLVIAGPDEGGHLRDLQAQVGSSGLGDVVMFIGPVNENQKPGTFGQADLFILPTHSENFGMAIAEALAHGLPVLTTTGAPWSSLPERGCGWWVEPSVSGLEAGLREATSLGRPRLEAMGAESRRLIAERFSWDIVARDMTALYEDLVAGRGEKAG